MARKSINKRIIGLVIGTTVAGMAKMASSDQGKKKIKTWKEKLLGMTGGALDFMQSGVQEMKKLSDKKDPKAKK